MGDKSLERFRLEYEKLHRALKKSHDNEKRLIKKCRELNSEIVSNAAKVQTALRLSTEDRNNLALLRKASAHVRVPGLHAMLCVLLAFTSAQCDDRCEGSAGC